MMAERDNDMVQAEGRQRLDVQTSIQMVSQFAGRDISFAAEADGAHCTGRKRGICVMIDTRHESDVIVALQIPSMIGMRLKARCEQRFTFASVSKRRSSEALRANAKPMSTSRF
jgi:hypothetical protein